MAHHRSALLPPLLPRIQSGSGSRLHPPENFIYRRPILEEVKKSVPKHHRLHHAVLDKSEAAIQRCLAEELSASEYNNALKSAIQFTDGQTVKLLLDNIPVDFHKLHQTTLHFAVQYGNDEICRLMLEIEEFQQMVNFDDRLGGTPLLYAWIGSVVEMLLAAGALVDFKNQRDNTPLCIACMNGNLTTADILIDIGANVNHKNKEGLTPILLAVKCPNLESHGREVLVKKLLAAGSFVDCEDIRGDTPLMFACYLGDLSIAAALVDATADFNHQNATGFTPLMIVLQDRNFRKHGIGPAAGCSCVHVGMQSPARAPNVPQSTIVQLVRLLLRSGAAMDIRNETTGMNVIHQTVIQPDRNLIIDTFIEAGCDIEAISGRNHTALIYAILYKQARSVHQLIQANCQVDYIPAGYKLGFAPPIRQCLPFEQLLRMYSNSGNRSGCQSCDFVSRFGDISYTPFEMAFLLSSDLADCGAQLTRNEDLCHTLGNLIHIMGMLVHAGAKVFSQTIYLPEGLRNIAVCADYIESRGYGRNLKCTIKMLTEALSTPQSLTVLARTILRRSLGRNLYQKLATLGLQPYLCDLITLKELQELHDSVVPHRDTPYPVRLF